MSSTARSAHRFSRFRPPNCGGDLPAAPAGWAPGLIKSSVARPCAPGTCAQSLEISLCTLSRGSPQEIRLRRCKRCGHTVDPYVEFEILLVFMDLQLFREGVCGGRRGSVVPTSCGAGSLGEELAQVGGHSRSPKTRRCGPNTCTLLPQRPEDAEGTSTDVRTAIRCQGEARVSKLGAKHRSRILPKTCSYWSEAPSDP